MGFCNEEQAQKFLKAVGRDEQTRRLKSRINDGRKIRELSPMYLKSYRRRCDST